jgi:hypothetical protein
MEIAMWTTIFPTAVAAAIVACLTHLASELNNIRPARQGPGIEFTVQQDVSAWLKSEGSSRRGAQQDKNREPGA